MRILPGLGAVREAARYVKKETLPEVQCLNNFFPKMHTTANPLYVVLRIHQPSRIRIVRAVRIYKGNSKYFERYAYVRASIKVKYFCHYHPWSLWKT